jgi:hypothetical protein
VNEFEPGRVGSLVLTRDEEIGGAEVGEAGEGGTLVSRRGWVSQGPLAFSGRSGLRLLILCLREVSVDKAAGTEGLQGLSGAGMGGFPSSEKLLEFSESEVSSTSLAVAGKAVGTGTEGLHRPSLSLTWASTKVYCPSVLRHNSKVNTYMC